MNVQLNVLVGMAITLQTCVLDVLAGSLCQTKALHGFPQSLKEIPG